MLFNAKGVRLGGHIASAATRANTYGWCASQRVPLPSKLRWRYKRSGRDGRHIEFPLFVIDCPVREDLSYTLADKAGQARRATWSWSMESRGALTAIGKLHATEKVLFAARRRDPLRAVPEAHNPNEWIYGSMDARSPTGSPSHQVGIALRLRRSESGLSQLTIDETHRGRGLCKRF